MDEHTAAVHNRKGVATGNQKEKGWGKLKKPLITPLPPNRPARTCGPWRRCCCPRALVSKTHVLLTSVPFHHPPFSPATLLTLHPHPFSETDSLLAKLLEMGYEPQQASVRARTHLRSCLPLHISLVCRARLPPCQRRVKCRRCTWLSSAC